MSLTGRARTVLRLGPGGWLRVVRTAVVARRIERSLRTDPLPVTAELFGARLDLASPANTGDLRFTPGEEKALAVALRTLAYPRFNGTCLRRALVMADILRERKPILRVGVAKEQGEVFAHAWIEIDGVAIDAMRDRTYHVPSGGAAG